MVNQCAAMVRGGLWVRSIWQRRTGLWQGVNPRSLTREGVRLFWRSSTTWHPHPPFPWHYCSLTVDPLLVPRMDGSVICCISCMTMSRIFRYWFLSKIWWIEILVDVKDVCRACECVAPQMPASSSYGASALVPRVVSEYIRIAKKKKDDIDLVIYKMLKSCIDCWLSLAGSVLSVKLQYFLYLGMC